MMKGVEGGDQHERSMERVRNEIQKWGQQQSEPRGAERGEEWYYYKPPTGKGY